MKRRFFPLIVVVVALIVYEGRGVLLAPFGSGTPGHPESGAPVPDPTAAGGEGQPVSATERTGEPTPVQTRHGAISKGTSFFVEMQQAGLEPQDIHRIVEASEEAYNFKKVRAGQKYTLFQGSGGMPDSLHFAIDSENLLKVRRAAGGYEARLDTVPYHIEHYVTGGTIENSIYETLQGQGANPELAAYLAVIYQWDIDFFKDIRAGDTFTILYESKVFENGKTEMGNVLAARIYTQGQEHYAIAYRTAAGSRNYYDEKGRSLQKSLLKAPLRYSRISSNFTYKRLHPVTRTYKPHLGVDYVAPRGTPVRSTGDGTVVAATRDRGNGKYVKIRHNSRYTTYYLHLQGFAKGVRKGTRVKQGQVIGYLGSTGLVTAPHLDYRIKVNGKFVNPRTVKLPSKHPVPAEEMALFEVRRDACLLSLLEASGKNHTVLVRKPTPPLQKRMTAVF